MKLYIYYYLKLIIAITSESSLRDKWEKAVKRRADSKNSFRVEEENSII